MLTGYSTRLSAKQSETITFMVSTDQPSFDVSIVRLRHGDSSSKGPGRKEEMVPASVAGSYPGQQQALHPGSAVIVARDAGLAVPDKFSIFIWMFPTRIAGGTQTILAGDGGLWLGLIDGGRLAFKAGHSMVRLDAPALERVWQWVSVSFADGTATLSTGLRPDCATMSNDQSASGELGAVAVGAMSMAFGATMVDGHATEGFNGKLADPMVFGRMLSASELSAAARLSDLTEAPAGCAAAWDFSLTGSADIVPDVVGGHHGQTHQSPTRHVTGPHWTGEFLDPRLDPRGYAAMHFHEDMLADAGWSPSFSLTIPDTYPSGVYAARIVAGSEVEYLPFFVVAERGTTRNRVALLMPTFTYMAYGNEMWRDYGLNCLYDHYVDGSGVTLASILHPIKTFRPDRGLLKSVSGERFGRHLCADLYFVDWAATVGIDIDIITDHELHFERLSAVEPYDAVVTGSHPEYVSARMLDALEAYLGHGGSLAYLGGNGFYSVTTLSDDGATVEVRRPNGTRPSNAEPGEAHHAMTGEPGGIWRGRGRAPQRLVGVGFTAQGWTSRDECGLPRPYQQAARDTELARELMQGIAPEIPIGDFVTLGLGRGAAGDEVDRADYRLGTPAQAAILASATGFSTDYQLVIEERRDVNESSTLPGNELVRSDIVAFETPAGGLVFSVGSMQWFSALSANNYDNDVSTLTRNVLRRMLG